jgi:hypothetical protein
MADTYLHAEKTDGWKDMPKPMDMFLFVKKN